MVSRNLARYTWHDTLGTITIHIRGRARGRGGGGEPHLDEFVMHKRRGEGAWNVRYRHTHPQAQGAPSPTPPTCPHMPPPLPGRIGAHPRTALLPLRLLPPHLEDAVHISSLFALSLCLLDVEPRLLGHLGEERRGRGTLGAVLLQGREDGRGRVLVVLAPHLGPSTHIAPGQLPPPPHERMETRAPTPPLPPSPHPPRSTGCKLVPPPAAAVHPYIRLRGRRRRNTQYASELLQHACSTTERYIRTCSGTSCSGGGPAGPPAVSRLALRGRI